MTLAFATADDFVAAYHPADGGTVSTRTRTDGTIGERVLIEISFPGLPNRALLRADVTGIAFEHGLRFAIAAEDVTTRDFLLGVARGEVRVESTIHRDHARFPATLNVAWRVGAGAATTTTLEDLSAGGAFLRAEAPPAIGAEVSLDITTPAGEVLPATGHVAWIRQGKDPGFGVDFAPAAGEAGRKLRALLRHASESASVDL
ncbi:MAG: PilZ domain-containing protein [Kofleriaceae bacterium]